MTDSSRLKDRVVMVTGGGGGIGKGACERIADEGGLVAVLDLRAELAEEVAAGINAKGGRAIALTCNVAVESEVKAAVAETVKTFGSLYGMVANAGTAGSGWIHETAIADWHAVLGVNLTGPFLCAKHAIPYMIENGSGAFVVTSFYCRIRHWCRRSGSFLCCIQSRCHCFGETDCRRLWFPKHQSQCYTTRPSGK